MDKKMTARGFFATLALLLFLLSLSLSLFSCADSDPKPKQKVYYGYFDTVSVLYDYTGMPDEEFSQLSAFVEERILHYHRLFDIYNEYDGTVNIKSINDAAGEGSITVSREIIDLLLFSREMYRLTEGKVNVAMGAVLSLWHELRTSDSSEKRIPTREELDSLSEHTSIDSLVIDEKNLTVEITDPHLSLDVGAIAKGYTAEKIRAELREKGYTGLVLDMGGNLCALGTKPSGEGWKSGIRNPLYYEGEAEPYVRTVTLVDSALVTSGGYERYYVVDGEIYHHIIDPETLMPERRYLSVSVHTESSAVADALSTAIFNMDPNEARLFVSSLEKTEVTVVYIDGRSEIFEGESAPLGS